MPLNPALQCTGTRTNGQRCATPVVRGTLFCFIHAPNARELAAKGGAARRAQIHALPGQPLPSTLRPILNRLKVIFGKAERGQITPDTARACAQVATAMARLVTVGTLEERMSQLEARMAAPTGGEPGAHTA